ncbi:MAG: DUF1592 domain-containing protein [bacterium]|nr:DUF1592 domain-containing protein [bacterium]
MTPLVLCLALAQGDPYIGRYCARCHGPEDEFPLTSSIEVDPDTWAYVAERVRAGEMPPKGEVRPSEDETRAFLAWIDGELGERPAEPIDPGRPVVRRLSGTEYQNSVRDLVGVDFDVRGRFPSDEVGFGYDTVGAAQSLPDDLLEKYLDAARDIADAAVVVEDWDEPPVRRVAAAGLEGKGRLRGASRILTTVGTVGAKHVFPRDGRYRVTVHAWAQQAGPEAARMSVLAGGREVGSVDVAAEKKEYAFEVELEGGESQVAARFLNDYYRPEDPDPDQRDRNLLVQWIEVEGPLDAAPRSDFQRALLERFGPELGRGRLRAILEHLALRVWRRPAQRAEVRRLELLVADARSLDAQVRLALEALLASPHFLFKVEVDGKSAGGERVRPLGDYELATNLAYFLWSTVPDEGLLAAAAGGELRTRAGRDAAVTRILASERSRAFAEGFAAQWLQLRVLEDVEIDPDRFPRFDAELEASMVAETLALFASVLREGKSAWELLDADYSFVDARLIEHYGLEGEAEGVEGFARVSLAGTQRRGVLGHASILTLTSDPTRTSPVKRGKWVLDVLLGAAPPPPPPGAGTLDESPAAVRGASMRERLDQHRQDAACAVCHARMDPLGFGLETFDATGAWRTADEHGPVDASGVLPDGRSFDGPLGLVELLREDDGFLENLVREMLVYALGRGLERSDRRTVRAILAALDAEKPTLEGIVRGVVHSIPFTQRRVGE